MNRYEQWLKDNPTPPKESKLSWKEGGPACCNRGMKIARRRGMDRHRHWFCEICSTSITDEQAHALAPPDYMDMNGVVRSSFERALDNGTYVPSNEHANDTFDADDLFEAW